MYTVVVCSNCKYVWIVKNRPKTSQCGKCRKRRKFKLLKKYHKTTNKEEAELARAFYQSRVHGQEERFDEALDAGVLEEDLNAFISESEYLDLQGMDGDAVENAVENIIHPSTSRSEIKILRDAFIELDNPDIDDVLEYTREYNVEDENAVLKLEGLVREGTIDPDSIRVSDIEKRIEELFDQPEFERSVPNEEDRGSGSSSSHQNIIIRAVEEHGDESVDAILDQAETDGMPRQKAIISLEKLAQSGRIEPDIDLKTITDARISIIGEATKNNKQGDQRRKDQETENETKQEDSESSNLSQREIMEKAIENQDNPTEEDVFNYASEHGLNDNKTQKLLQKMKQYGQVQESNDYTLRLV